jgi:nucleotide-binding universal stress UspA family protein
MDEQATIVVGVDGSDCARSALEFALDEATRRGAQVRVVWAFPPPEYWATAYGMPAPPPLDGAPVVAVYGWHERDYSASSMSTWTRSAERIAAAERVLGEILAPWQAKYPSRPLG